ncbi:hypothetical protein [Sulfuracidifex tepidarius]|uniref:Uncharacterized protein n=1 Tax=Sulfuracidifex tepidarius TaxID=1294262 RepID=A0A510E483_9CREN|nr:hypothetical protein [Sulfuracidifex tepidarius]BBG27286.1 hypothetical protein IC007_1831 [Sulfuracidifex tepidarius]
MQELFHEKTLRIRWGLPVDQRVEAEVGKTLMNVMSSVKGVEIADNEGMILKVEMTEDQVEWVKELRNGLYYVDVWFEGEDPEKVKRERLERWAEKLDFSPDYEEGEVDE